MKLRSVGRGRDFFLALKKVERECSKCERGEYLAGQNNDREDGRIPFLFQRHDPVDVSKGGCQRHNDQTRSAEDQKLAAWGWVWRFVLVQRPAPQLPGDQQPHTKEEDRANDEAPIVQVCSGGANGVAFSTA